MTELHSEKSAAECVDVVKAEDLIPILAALKASQQRWRRTAVGFAFAFVVLLVLAIVQFSGTLMACKLVGEANRAREAADVQVKPVEQLAKQLDNAAHYTATLQEELRVMHSEHRKAMADSGREARLAAEHRAEMSLALKKLQDKLRALEDRTAGAE